MGLSESCPQRAGERVPRFVLGIDTATRTASVGVLDGDDLIAERSQPDSRTLAVTALPLVQDVLAAAGCDVADLGMIAVSAGPGSFTGLRIGLSLAKGISLATGCAVIAVPTLEALAQVAGERDGLICPVLDARKGEVYAASFRWQTSGPLRVSEDCAATPQRLAAAIEEPCVLLGDGVEAYLALWRDAFGQSVELLPFTEFHPRGGAVAAVGRRRFGDLGADEVAAMVPRYVRAAEAEVRLRAEGEPRNGRGKGKIDRAGGLG